jgi:hypothetical protein
VGWASGSEIEKSSMTTPSKWHVPNPRAQVFLDAVRKESEFRGGELGEWTRCSHGFGALCKTCETTVYVKPMTRRIKWCECCRRDENEFDFIPKLRLKSWHTSGWFRVQPKLKGEK